MRFRNKQPPGVKPFLFRERDHFVRERAGLFGLGVRGHDPLLENESPHKIPQQGFPVFASNA